MLEKWMKGTPNRENSKSKKAPKTTKMFGE